MFDKLALGVIASTVAFKYDKAGRLIAESYSAGDKQS